MPTRQSRPGHEAVVVEIVYALVSSAVVAAVIGLAVYVAASGVGLADSLPLDGLAVGLALGIWTGRTLVILVRFDRARRAAA